MNASAQRYAAVAIVLHWAIAVALLGMIPLGWWMGEALERPDTQAQAIAAFQLHKSIGLTVLALSLVRLAWRLMNPAPPLPETMKAWEKALAVAVHWAFYIIIIAMPLTGWLYVSAAWSIHDNRPLEVPTLYFGLFRIPHIPGLMTLEPAARSAVANVLMFIHSKLAWVIIGLATLHAAAALKHQFVDNDGVLSRMVPGLAGSGAGQSPASRSLVLAVGFAAIVLAAGGALWLFENPRTGAAAAPASVVHSHHPEEGAGADHDNALEASEDHGAEGAHDQHGTAQTAQAEDHAQQATTPPHAHGVPSWQVASASSSIAYTGVHAGVPFEGHFSSWRADIRFDPEDLEHSSATVTIDMRSASDGVALHDQSLPQEEWFDVAHHPTATFRTTSIQSRGSGSYEARGALTIKDRAINLNLPFTLSITGSRAVMDGTARINRADADLGMASDPGGDFVSRDVGVRVHVEATRSP